jgi:hypothetical protein
MAIEIVGFPIKMLICYSYVNVYQRVYTIYDKHSVLTMARRR